MALARGRDADARRRLPRRHGLTPSRSPPEPAEAVACRPPRSTAAAAAQGRVVAALAGRALTVQFRRAQLLMPTFCCRSMLLAVIASGTRRAPDLPASPTPRLPRIRRRPARCAGRAAGWADRRHALASDIEFGFFDRLLTAPVHRTSSCSAAFSRGDARASCCSCVFLCVAFVFGARYPGGVGGVPRSWCSAR